MADLVLFKSFYDLDEAQGLRDFLVSKGIVCEVKKHRPLLDTVYVGHTGDKTIYLLMEQKDFDKANGYIDEEIRSNIGAVGADYYLHSFSDEELLEVVQKPDEWNNQDVLIAQDLLAKRDRVVTDGEIVAAKKERRKELAKPQVASIWFLVASYIFTILFGLYGLFLALFLLNTKTVLPDGTKVPTYSPMTRLHARALLLLAFAGIISFVVRIYFVRTGRGFIPFPFALF